MTLSFVEAEPKAELVQQRLMQVVECAVDEQQQQHGEENKTNDGEQQPTTSPNWLDILVSSSSFGNRELLSVVVAVLYNALVRTIDGEEERFTSSLAESGLFVSTLLRHIVSSKNVTSNLVESKGVVIEDLEDDATEWITNLIMLFLYRGFLQTIYRSIGPVASILPEHVALLFCIRAEVEHVAKGSENKLFVSQKNCCDVHDFLGFRI